MPKPSREAIFSGANADREKSIFPVQLTTCRMGNLTRLIHTLAICVTIHNVGNKPAVILHTTFIAIIVSHIRRIGRQPGKTTLHSGQSRSSWSAEQGNVYSSSVYAIPVAYSFLHIPGMYAWATLSAEYDIYKVTKEWTFTMISRVVVVRHLGGLLCVVGPMVSLF